MDLYVDDDAFVRAPAPLVYGLLADPDHYEDWWPGFRMRAAAPAGSSWSSEARAEGGPRESGLVGRPREPGSSRFDFTLTVRGPHRRLQLRARPYRFRTDKGLYLALDGDLAGTVEWWLEGAHGGTVVHQLSRLDVRRGRVHRVSDAYRAAMRRAAGGLKDAAQTEVRRRAGLPP
jgi:uncharacterized protein YndB with AHSA1/START domain